MTPLTSDKFKRGVIFEITVIDTIKPTGQRSLPDFRALIIFFVSVNSFKKKKAFRELRAESRSRNISNSHSLFQKKLVPVKR